MGFVIKDNLEELSIEEIIKYKSDLKIYMSYLLSEAKKCKQQKEELGQILIERINHLEFEILITEEDRINNNPAYYDLLCRIH